MFAFASDLRDEGMETVLDNVAERAGVGGVTLAAAYHHGRDIFPHNPARKVHFLEGGTVFFQPDAARYRGLKLQPRVSRLAEESDVLAELCRHGSVRSMRIRAWTVFLHNYTLGESHPECSCRNAFGDPHLTDLCPANPDVRAYVRTLSGDIAAHGVAAVVAESLHYHGLDSTTSAKPGALRAHRPITGASPGQPKFGDPREIGPRAGWTLGDQRSVSTSAHGTAVLRGFTDLVGACADDADRDDLRALGLLPALGRAMSGFLWAG